jgi:hypothetical protein
MNNVTSQNAYAGSSRGLNGPVAAAIISVGVGGCALGALAVAGDFSKAVTRWLAFYPPTGALSGVTSIAVGAWLVAWYALAKRWQRKELAASKISFVAFLLLGVSLVLTFLPSVDGLLGK